MINLKVKKSKGVLALLIKSNLCCSVTPPHMVSREDDTHKPEGKLQT